MSRTNWNKTVPWREPEWSRVDVDEWQADRRGGRRKGTLNVPIRNPSGERKGGFQHTTPSSWITTAS